MTKNRYSISTLVTPEYYVAALRLEELVRKDLAYSLATKIVEDFPVNITLAPHPVRSDGSADFVHEMTLFIFSEQQLQEYVNQVVRAEIFTRAADNALWKLPETLAN